MLQDLELAYFFAIFWGLNIPALKFSNTFASLGATCLAKSMTTSY